MTDILAPLSSQVPIVDEKGRPTAYFQRLLQKLSAGSTLTVSPTGVLSVTDGSVTNVTLASMAAATIKANKEALTGPPEDCTLSQILDLVGSAAQGDILYRDATGWVRLPAGTSGNVLKTLGVGANPTWAASVSGRVLSAIFPGTGTATDLFASLGYHVVFPIDCTIVSIAALLKPGAIGRTYTINYAPYDPVTRKITAAPTIVRTFTSTAVATLLQVTADLTSPLVVTAGQTYAFWVSQTFSTTTTTPDTYFSTSAIVSSYYFNVPITQGIKLASNAPTTADTWTNQNAQWAISLLYSVP